MIATQCIALHYEVISLAVQALFIHGVFSLLTGVFYRI